MRKITTIISALLLGLIFLTGCSEGKIKNKQVDLNEVLNEIQAVVTMPETIDITTVEVGDFFDLDPVDFKTIIMKIAAESIVADEICLCEAIDEEAAARLKTGFEAHIESQKKSFKNYIPAEYAKLENIKVQQSENYIYYVIASNQTEADSILTKYFG